MKNYNSAIKRILALKGNKSKSSRQKIMPSLDYVEEQLESDRNGIESTSKETFFDESFQQNKSNKMIKEVGESNISPDNKGIIRDSAYLAKDNKKTVSRLGFYLIVITILLLLVDQILRPDAFKIQAFKVVAKYEKVEREEIVKLVDKYIGQNYFAVDLGELKKNIEAHPWVRSVSARKEWPAKIAIRIDEHEPVAFWNDQYLINSAGEVFLKPDEKVASNFVQLRGPKGSHLEIYNDYKNWVLKLKRKGYLVQELELTDIYAYELKLDVLNVSADEITGENLSSKDSGLKINLFVGSQNKFEQRMKRFLLIIENAIKKNILSIDSVDLRYEHGFSVKWLNNLKPIDQTL